mmetsp:Transcript_27442/g.62073  ORF Transcript_27442/g.62073 Transcript_27442/m.62073 type:complete len:89 (+) Transcript_27442:526-792(+)
MQAKRARRIPPNKQKHRQESTSTLPPCLLWLGASGSAGSKRAARAEPIKSAAQATNISQHIHRDHEQESIRLSTRQGEGAVAASTRCV